MLWVGCIRVTHPCAGRQHVLLHLLPLDLHVLGLPLAFILSQDQTLHCTSSLLTILLVISFDGFSSPLRFSFTSYLLLLILSMNFSFPALSFNPSFLGLQRYILFLFYPNLFYSFCDLFLLFFLCPVLNRFCLYPY